MSKFREPTPPSDPATALTVVTVPCSRERSLEQRTAEVEALNRAARDELILRMTYKMLRSTLDRVEALEPVPDDWRARLATRDAPRDDDQDGRDLDDDDLDDEDDDEEDDNSAL